MTAIVDRPTTTGSPTAGPNSRGKRSFSQLLGQLSRQSVEKHYDAYGDVHWDDDEMALDATDARLVLPEWDGLSQTEWYRNQPVEVRARIGTHRVAAMMKTGWHFENLLQQGLLKYSFSLPNRSPQFRYVHHEISEESQHTMMFQEFVDRTDLPVTGMPRTVIKPIEWLMGTIVKHAPAAFFFGVLAGEEPVDYIQKRTLRLDVNHPLVERIMKIHVTEEARHVSFAKGVIKEIVPKLGRTRRFALSVVTPLFMGMLTWMMVAPPKQLERSGVPAKVLREARRSQTNRELVRESAAKPKKLAEDLGLMNVVSRRLWKAVGL